MCVDVVETKECAMLGINLRLWKAAVDNTAPFLIRNRRALKTETDCAHAHTTVAVESS